MFKSSPNNDEHLTHFNNPSLLYTFIVDSSFIVIIFSEESMILSFSNNINKQKLQWYVSTKYVILLFFSRCHFRRNKLNHYFCYCVVMFTGNSHKNVIKCSHNFIFPLTSTVISSENIDCLFLIGSHRRIYIFVLEFRFTKFS